MVSTCGTHLDVSKVSRGSTNPCRLLRNCWIGNSILFKISERIYKIKSFPQHNSLPPFKITSHVFPIPPVPAFLRNLLPLALAFLLSHDVKGGVFWWKHKNTFQRRSLFRLPHPWGWASSLSLLFSFLFSLLLHSLQFSFLSCFVSSAPSEGWVLSLFQLSFSPLLCSPQF